VAPITNQTGPGVGVALYLDPSERQHGVTSDRLIARDTTAPAGSLVERVAGRIGMLAGFDNWKDEARAAIIEVAAALIDWHNSDQVVHTAWEAAKWLEREATNE